VPSASCGSKVLKGPWKPHTLPGMGNWSIEIRVPRSGNADLDTEVHRRALSELERQRVGRELYSMLRRKHQGSFLSREGASAVSTVAEAALAITRAWEGTRQGMPSELTVILHRNG